MVTGGVLTYRDRWAVELAARLMEKAVRTPSAATLLELIRSAELEPAEAKSIILRESISSSELSVLRSLLSAIGMTPADRSKISVKIDKPKSKFADLAEETKALRARPN